MRRAVPHLTLCALTIVGAITACSKSPEVFQEADRGTSVAQGPVDEGTPPPEPSSERALEVTDLIRLWVASATAADAVYEIPERAGKKVEGVLTAFHTVHKTKDNSYAVCADFKDGANTYDVDFVVKESTDGLEVVDQVLHQINGETVE